jgi:hypothetical protein
MELAHQKKAIDIIGAKAGPARAAPMVTATTPAGRR